ncbi:hypothetical protein QBC39DRAFT_384295 [Podospora conica]|nr:hypothetical protein QBC39DRAFT_384295 [Schizothecium conicum]
MATIRGRRILWPRSNAPPPPPPQPPQPSSRAPIVPNSRFVEGSMNDRASAAPPPSFLGPSEIAAYEAQFYNADRPRPLRPISSAGHYSHQEHEDHQNPLAHSRSQQQRKPGGFWDGMRERFFLTRSKSSSIADQLHDNPVAAAMANPITSPPGGPASYPTREEVLASYQSLVSSGFFDSHAIHGTRHPAPPTMGPPPPRTQRPLSTPHSITVPSPQRGTKRPSAIDDETGARKLVKRLRRSASRISVDLSVSFGSGSKPTPSRPSTSSHHHGAPSFVSSAASSICEQPEPKTPTTAIKKKLSKPMPPMTAVTRGRGGWRDRSRSRSRSRVRTAVQHQPVPNPLAMNPVSGTAAVDQRVLHVPLVDDAMLVDVDTTPRPSTDTLSGRGTVLHPPPSRGRSRSPRKAGAGPLSVVPDANRGIPGVPRIPEGLKGFGGLSPAKEGGVFGFPARRGEEMEGMEGVKMGGRDSGLGEEVENENGGVRGGW